MTPQSPEFAVDVIREHAICFNSFGVLYKKSLSMVTHNRWSVPSILDCIKEISSENVD
jgi:hypothetical protein